MEQELKLIIGTNRRKGSVETRWDLVSSVSDKAERWKRDNEGETKRQVKAKKWERGTR